MNYRITAPGFLLAVLLTGGVVPASAQAELGQAFANQPEPSAIANPETLAIGTAEAALAEGRQAYHQGQLGLAVERLSHAIAQFESAGNADGVAAAQVAIAPVYITMENRDAAAAAIQAALSHYQTEVNIAGEAQALVNLGALQTSEKDYPAALATLQRAAELSEQAQDSFTQGIASLYVGVIYGTQEDYANALPYIDQALPLLQDDSDALRQGYYQASALMFKAICLMGLEEFDQARVLVEPIQSINQSLHHPAIDGYLPFIQGTLAALQGDVDGALSSYQQSIALIQEWGFDRETEVLVNSAIGGIYFEQQDFEQASQAFDRILAILAEQNNVLGQLEFLFEIGNLHQENEYYAQAQAYYEAALPFAEATGRAAEGSVLNRVGLMLYFQEQYEQALKFFLPALEAMQDVGDHADEPTILGNIANTYQQLGEFGKAEEYRLQVIVWHQQNVISAENSENYDAAFASLTQISDHYSNQTQAFLNMGREHLKSDPKDARNSARDAIEAGELSLHYAQQMLQLAQSHGRDNWMAKVNLHTAIALISTGQAYQLEGQAFQALNRLQDKVNSEERSLEAFERALPFSLSAEDERLENLSYRVIIGAQTGLASSYNSVGEHEKAVEIGLKALQSSREINNLEMEIFSLSALGDPYTNLASQYRREGRFEEALEILAHAESLNKEIIAISDRSDSIDVDKSQQKQALGRLWVVSLQRQGVYKDQNLYEEFLEAAYETLSIAQQLEEGEIGYISTGFRSVADAYHSLNRYSEALVAYERFRQFAIEKNDFRNQSFALYRMGIVHVAQSQYPDAIDKFEQAITIAKENNIIQYQVDALDYLSSVYAAQGRYDQAIEELNGSLALIRGVRTQLETALTPELLNEVCYLGFTDIFSSKNEEDDFLRGNLALINYQQSLDEQRLENTREGCMESTWHTESSILHGMGGVYTSQGRYLDALNFYNQSLAIDQEIGAGEVSFAITYEEIGDVYRLQGNYGAALEFYEKALDIYVRRNSRYRQATTLNSIGIVFDNQGQYAKALEYYQQALALAKELGRQGLQSSIQFNMASFSSIQGYFQESLETYYQTLEVDRALGRRAGEVTVLNSIASTYYAQGQLDLAEQTYIEALAIAQEIGSRNLEISIIGGLGSVAEVKGDYATALNHYQQALEIAEEIDSQVQISATLYSLGFIHLRLGQYAIALDYYQRSLDIDLANGSIDGQAVTLSSMAGVYYRQQQYDQATDYNLQALAIHQGAGNLLGQVRALDGIGIAHERQGNYEQALIAYQEALDLVSDMDARFLQAAVLGGLGLTYGGLGDTEQAMDYLEQALAINRTIGNPAGEAIVLADMGKVLAQSDQEDLAIAFYKQAVNLREGIREGIRSLDQALQQSYIDSIAETYRTLADLLLSQGRIPEAQQVLDLLQLEEVREFTHTRALWTGSSLAYTDIEQPIVEAHGDLIAFGKVFYECQQTNCDRLDELSAQRTQLNDQYNAQVATFRDQVRQNRSQDEGFLDPDRLGSSARNLLQAHPNSVLIYPFVTEEKLWLLWASAGAYGTIEQEVSQADLARAVQRFGELLTTGGNEAELQAASQQLYNWLVKPMETSLQANGVQKLIFVNDRVTRYIPMAALFDGNGYLLERYTVSTVISPAITDTTRRLGPVDEAPVLGLGLTQPIAGFSPLPAVREELTQIVRSPDTAGIFPGNVFLDEAFTLQNLERNLLNHRVLHIATHAEFVPGRPGDSYILLGDGKRLDVNAINAREHLLQNLHLVVLSACQTALGGPAGDGSEIAGISSYFLDEGRAQTVVASLWKVNDGSTSLLMQRFYELLATGELTKAEALRQAQLSLLYNEDTETRLAATRSDINYVTNANRTTPTLSSQHPYHWAPFILIGNGL
jgi:CHAT domain-containing protein/tetratricopeptide (TPR) repeat protein